MLNIKHVILPSLFLLLTPHHANGFASIACGYDEFDQLVCRSSSNETTTNISMSAALARCNAADLHNCKLAASFQNVCQSVAWSKASPTELAIGTGGTQSDANNAAIHLCNQLYSRECISIAVTCDNISLPLSNPATIKHPSQPQPSPSGSSILILILAKFLNLVNMGAVGTGISFGVGVIIALLVYTKRSRLINFIIHGNLPYKLAAYADDVEVLFKRSQRVNWYGRVVFGLTARLGLTEKQLALVRRYWLGRTIVFDSLRRQRQNQLAKMHLQLIAAARPPAPADKTFLSQLWAILKYTLFVLFYLLRALFSFLFGFFFIRVTIAKLARGKLIESQKLALILQAKQATEESVAYLKEYLEVAETFDGQEELFEPK